jgi:hypothetical protein
VLLEAHASDQLVLSRAQAQEGPAPILNFELQGNFPNPLNERTSVWYTIPETTSTQLTVFDVLGREVMEFRREDDAGRHSFNLDASSLASGLYVYVVTAGGQRASGKMVVSR